MAVSVGWSNPNVPASRADVVCWWNERREFNLSGKDAIVSADSKDITPDLHGEDGVGVCCKRRVVR